ncbi:MAG: hypothetical protein LBJ59_04530 [Zoogloeaceae bacterium]|nr:hypothetical protein [Zoogloeaceae bacterium]
MTPPEVFKVHPGLLGEPVPPELQPLQDTQTPAAEAKVEAETPDAADSAAPR